MEDLHWLETLAPEGEVIVTRIIYASKPTKIDIRINRGLKARIKLEFKKGCIEQDIEVTMSFNPATTELLITPNITLSEPVKLNYSLNGLKVSDLEKIKFIYFTSEDDYETVSWRKLKVKQGSIMLKDAELKHFSRFGFLR